MGAQFSGKVTWLGHACFLVETGDGKRVVLDPFIEKNPNATRISTPPHATGLAFDVYNFFMTATEQDYLMAVIARMKDAGRVEALRENRDHIHVFAFADGARPDEKLIASSLRVTRPPQ